MRTTALAGVLVFALCVLLRIGLVDRHGLWSDECFSLAMATGHSVEHPAGRANPAFGDYMETPGAVSPAAYSRYLEHEVPPASLKRVLRAVFLSDTSPPLYYILLYGWTLGLGTGDAALRLFSILWALACFPLMWSLAKRLGGEASAVPTCIFFAVSPLCIFYSTEGRMYSLFLFCTVCMMWLTLRLWDRGASAARFSLWVAAGVGGLLTHYFFVFVWAAGLLWTQLHPGRFPRRLSWAGALLTVLLVLPWYIHIPESLSQWRVTGYWLTMPPNWCPYHPITTPLLLPWRFWTFLSIDGIWGGHRYLNWINACVFLLLAVAALRRLSWSVFSAPRNLLWFWLLSPCIALVVFDLVRWTYVTASPRFALAGMPAAFLLTGLGLGSLTFRQRAVFIVLIVFFCSIGVGSYYLADRRSYQNYPEVAKLLAHQVNESDLILVHSVPCGVAGVARYLEKAGASKTGVRFASWVGQLGQRRVPEDLEALAAGQRRIILVTTHTVGDPTPEQSWLEENATLVETKRIYGATLRYFTPRDSTRFLAPPT